MIKAVIILRNGSEITIQTDVLHVERDRHGNVKRMEEYFPQAYNLYCDKIDELTRAAATGGGTP